MAETALSLLDDALNLPLEERRALATALMDSVDHPVDPGWEDAWAEELTRRARAADAREVRGEAWEVVRDQIRAQLRR